MNKKQDENYLRKELMVHKSLVTEFEKIAKAQKKSVKAVMEKALDNFINPECELGSVDISFVKDLFQNRDRLNLGEAQ